MFEFISVGIATVFLLYFFIAGAMAGMIIAKDKELLKVMSRTERTFLALLILFWPVSALIGARLEYMDSVQNRKG